MALGGRDIDGPVAGAADVGLPTLLDTLERAFIGLVVVAALGRADQFAELVVEPLGAEIALLLRHPFLQAEMRFDHKLRHLLLPGFASCAGAAGRVSFDGRIATREHYAMPQRECFICPRWNIP